MNHGFREALAPSFAARSGRGRLPDGCWHAVYGVTARPRPPKGKGGARTAWNDGKSTRRCTGAEAFLPRLRMRTAVCLEWQNSA